MFTASKGCWKVTAGEFASVACRVTSKRLHVIAEMILQKVDAYLCQSVVRTTEVIPGELIRKETERSCKFVLMNLPKG